MLLCFDGSDGSRHAIAAAAALGIGGQAVVCHSWSGMSHAMFHGNLGAVPPPLEKAIDDLDELDREAAERLAGEGARAAREAGFDAAPAAVKQEAKAWRTLLAVASERHAGLIVVGAHGRSGLERLLTGSVSSAVLTHARVPVLVVPEGPHPGHGGPLLLCYDGSDNARRSIEIAGERFPGRRAIVLHAWESWFARATALSAVVPPVYGMERELDEIAEEQCEKAAGAGVTLAKECGLDAEALMVKVDAGPVWRAVLDAAEEHDAAAIVMGTRGLTGISQALGSVSHGVVNHARLPVLVVPPES
ncbi:MAG: universal stress protein [Thermoleophilaceae bacterium]|nr:universal stress protein [Thermoleophilaceae bacterium]